MVARDVEAAWAALVAARREGASGARAFGVVVVGARIHVGDGASFFCHVMERVAAGRWELWRLESDGASAVFAIRVGASPTLWLDAGSIALDTTLGAFIPDEAAEEIQALEDDEVVVDFTSELAGDGSAPARREALVATPGGAPLALFHTSRPGVHTVTKGLDARGLVCALAVLV